MVIMDELKLYCEKASCKSNSTGICFANKEKMPICCAICQTSENCNFVCKKIKWANKVKKNKKILIKEVNKIIKKTYSHKKEFILKVVVEKLLK